MVSAGRARFRDLLCTMGVSLLGLVFATSCDMDHSPMAQGEESVAPAGKTYLRFAPGATARAAKVLGGDEESDGDEKSDKKHTQTKRIGPEGGTLKVGEKYGKGGRDDLMVFFHVPEGALDEKVEITMRLRGDNLENLVLEFSPEGLRFNIPAQLRIKLGKDRVNLPIESVVALHQNADGSVEQVEILRIEEERDSYWIIVEVPGFSLYSLGGGL